MAAPQTEPTGLSLEEIQESLRGDLVPTVQNYRYEELVREVVPLTEFDLQMLQQEGPSRSQSGIQHLRAIHHVVALKLALGEKPVEICSTLTLTPQTISKLQKDEQFSKMVEEYREGLITRAVDTYELMSVLKAETLTAIHERLIGAERDTIPVEGLRRLLETLADRTGESPIRRSETLSRVSHEVTAESIRRIKALHNEDSAYCPETVDAQVVQAHEEESKNNGAAVSIAGAFKPLAEGKTEGEEGGGQGV